MFWSGTVWESKKCVCCMIEWCWFISISFLIFPLQHLIKPSSARHIMRKLSLFSSFSTFILYYSSFNLLHRRPSFLYFNSSLFTFQRSVILLMIMAVFLKMYSLFTHPLTFQLIFVRYHLFWLSSPCPSICK